MREGERAYLVGLGAFTVGHVAYVVTALLVGVTWTTALWAGCSATTGSPGPSAMVASS